MLQYAIDVRTITNDATAYAALLQGCLADATPTLTCRLDATSVLRRATDDDDDDDGRGGRDGDDDEEGEGSDSHGGDDSLDDLFGTGGDTGGKDSSRRRRRRRHDHYDHDNDRDRDTSHDDGGPGDAPVLGGSGRVVFQLRSQLLPVLGLTYDLPAALSNLTAHRVVDLASIKCGVVFGTPLNMQPAAAASFEHGFSDYADNLERADRLLAALHAANAGIVCISRSSSSKRSSSGGGSSSSSSSSKGKPPAVAFHIMVPSRPGVVEAMLYRIGVREMMVQHTAPASSIVQQLPSPSLRTPTSLSSITSSMAASVVASASSMDLLAVGGVNVVNGETRDGDNDTAAASSSSAEGSGSSGNNGEIEDGKSAASSATLFTDIVRCDPLKYTAESVTVPTRGGGGDGSDGGDGGNRIGDDDGRDHDDHDDHDDYDGGSGGDDGDGDGRARRRRGSSRGATRGGHEDTVGGGTSSSIDRSTRGGGKSRRRTGGIGHGTHTPSVGTSVAAEASTGAPRHGHYDEYEDYEEDRHTSEGVGQGEGRGRRGGRRGGGERGRTGSHSTTTMAINGDENDHDGGSNGGNAGRGGGSGRGGGGGGGGSRRSGSHQTTSSGNPTEGKRNAKKQRRSLQLQRRR